MSINRPPRVFATPLQMAVDSEINEIRNNPARLERLLKEVVVKRNIETRRQEITMLQQMIQGRCSSKRTLRNGVETDAATATGMYDHD